jgi:hypothetical protein
MQPNVSGRWQIMPIAAEQCLKNCADGRIKKEYLLTGPFSQHTAQCLAAFGSVQILTFLPEPLFTLVRLPKTNMRAIIGGNVLEVWCDPADLPNAEPEIYRLLAGDTARAGE